MSQCDTPSSTRQRISPSRSTDNKQMNILCSLGTLIAVVEGMLVIATAHSTSSDPQIDTLMYLHTFYSQKR